MGDWVTFTSEQRVHSWRQSDWSNGDNMALTGAIQVASLHLTALFLCDLSLFYKACGLHSKALPLLHAAWLAPLQGISFLGPCLTFGPLGLILFVCLCVIFQLIKLIKWANWRFGDLNYVPLRGDLCARRVHKHGAQSRRLDFGIELAALLWKPISLRSINTGS